MGALGSTKSGAALTIGQCGPSSAVLGPTQTTGIDAGGEGRRARAIGNVVTLRSPCHWNKEVARRLQYVRAVCSSVLHSSLHFASSGKLHRQRGMTGPHSPTIMSRSNQLAHWGSFGSIHSLSFVLAIPLHVIIASYWSLPLLPVDCFC